jgi:hypothetical protein
MSHAQPTVAEKIRRAPEAAQQDRPRSGTVRRLAAPQPGGLTVGRADDPAERAADRVADEVIARLQADVDGAPLDASAERPDSVQRSLADSAAPEVGFEGGPLSGELSTRINHSRGRGAPLSGATRGRMEAAFGTDLGSVRVHEDREAAELSRMVSARAFTHDQDIFFGAGEYRPDTPEGERVLAHEIAHTRQQSGVHRLHRLWNIKKPNWKATVSIKTLPSRPIWFFKDDSGDQMVVKSEDQPVGLGSLIGEMHESASGVKSVKQAKLSQSDRDLAARLLSDSSVANDMSWDRYGQHVISEGKDDGSQGAWWAGMNSASQIAKSGKGNVVAMTLAHGEEAGAKGKVDPHAGAVDNDRSPIRRMLMDPQHMKLLGKMTAIDLFMGNEDRVFNGNIGNWFYDPNGAITVIDHVDPGPEGRNLGTAVLTLDFTKWKNEMGQHLTSSGSGMKDAASHALKRTFVNLDDGNDKGIFDWSNGKEQGEAKTRRQVMADNFVAGMVEGRAHVIKIFSTTKWKGSKSAHKAKKNIRKAAQAASVVDAAEFGGAKVDYYQVLKDRVTWLKAN